MKRFKIECDGENTKIWLGDEEISGIVDTVEFKQMADSPPQVKLIFCPIDPVKFFGARKAGEKDR